MTPREFRDLTIREQQIAVLRWLQAFERFTLEAVVQRFGGVGVSRNRVRQILLGLLDGSEIRILVRRPPPDIMPKRWREAYGALECSVLGHAVGATQTIWGALPGRTVREIRAVLAPHRQLCVAFNRAFRFPPNAGMGGGGPIDAPCAPAQGAQLRGHPREQSGSGGVP